MMRHSRSSVPRLPARAAGAERLTMHAGGERPWAMHGVAMLARTDAKARWSWVRRHGSIPTAAARALRHLALHRDFRFSPGYGCQSVWQRNVRYPNLNHGQDTRGWSVPCVSIQLTLSQSLYNTVPHRALRAHPAAGSPSGTPAPPAPGSSRSSVIETLWPYLHPACRLGVIPVALMAIWRYCRNTQGTFVSY